MTDGDRGSLEGPCLVEIAGVAGAGKSTLARRLSRGEGGDVRVGDFIHTRTPAHLRYVVHSLPRIAPILAGTLGPGPRLSWPEAKLLVYVTEWHRFLCSRAEYEGGVTLLDQGPLYALVRLKAQGKNVTGRAAFERWWNEMLEQWASHLDLVVWLDAPDAVLWERINGRDQRHTTKSASREAGLRFLGRYRTLFDDVLRRVDEVGGPSVLRIDTGGLPADDIATAIEPLLKATASTAVGGGVPHAG